MYENGNKPLCDSVQNELISLATIAVSFWTVTLHRGVSHKEILPYLYEFSYSANVFF
jgi:hypothetical protein